MNQDSKVAQFQEPKTITWKYQKVLLNNIDLNPVLDHVKAKELDSKTNIDHAHFHYLN